MKIPLFSASLLLLATASMASNIFDSNDDGKEGLAESVHSLQVASELINAPDPIASYGGVAVVSKSGGDYTDPRLAMSDIADWCGTPADDHPCLLQIMPGIYDLAENALSMADYVDIAGSGRNNTIITSTHSSGSGAAGSATLVGADNSELRHLSVINQGGGENSIGIYNFTNDTFSVRDVSVTVSGGTVNNYGIANIGSDTKQISRNMNISNVTVSVSDAFSIGIANKLASPSMTDIHINPQGTTQSVGIYNLTYSSPLIRGLTVNIGQGNSTLNYGVGNYEHSKPKMTNVDITIDVALEGAERNYGIANDGSCLATLTNSRLRVLNRGFSIENVNGSRALVANTQLTGAVDGASMECIGAYNNVYVLLDTACR